MTHTVSTVYIAEVKGESWEGRAIRAEFRFDHEPSADELFAKTGDFRDISRAVVYQETVVTCTHRKKVGSYIPTITNFASA